MNLFFGEVAYEMNRQVFSPRLVWPNCIGRADDMVWHNKGDTTLPWVGGSVGKEAIFEFLGVFSSNLETTTWQNTDRFASGDTVAVFGKMNGRTIKSGKEIGEFTFALRAKVRDEQVVLWHWFEDSFAVGRAYYGEILTGDTVMAIQTIGLSFATNEFHAPVLPGQ